MKPKLTLIDKEKPQLKTSYSRPKYLASDIPKPILKSSFKAALNSLDKKKKEF